MPMISTANIPMNQAAPADSRRRAPSRLAAFLTADDDWIARHPGIAMAALWIAVLVVPGVIEWMI